MNEDSTLNVVLKWHGAVKRWSCVIDGCVRKKLDVVRLGSN